MGSKYPENVMLSLKTKSLESNTRSNQLMCTWDLNCSSPAIQGPLSIRIWVRIQSPSFAASHRSHWTEAPAFQQRLPWKKSACRPCQQQIWLDCSSRQSRIPQYTEASIYSIPTGNVNHSEVTVHPLWFISSFLWCMASSGPTIKSYSSQPCP